MVELVRQISALANQVARAAGGGAIGAEVRMASLDIGFDRGELRPAASVEGEGGDRQVLGPGWHASLAALLTSPGSGESRTSLDEAIEEVRRQIEESDAREQQVLAGSLIVSSSLSVGYVLWLVRGGALLASLSAALPAWANLDPLPVLSRVRSSAGSVGRGGAAGGDGGDPIERLFARARGWFGTPAASPGAGGAPAADPQPPSATQASATLEASVEPRRDPSRDLVAPAASQPVEGGAR